MVSLKLTLFGSPQLTLNQNVIDLPQRKVLALLLYMASNRQLHRRDTLTALLWPEAGQSAARTALRRELYTLTNTLGSTWFISDREHIGIDPAAALTTDVEDFRTLVAASRRQQNTAGGSDEATVVVLQEAVERYTADFLSGFSLSECPEFNEWRAFEAESLRRDYAAALETLIQWHEEQAAYDQAIATARRWLALDAMHEPAHQRLMRLFALAGQSAAALRQYEECVRILREDLDVAPAAATGALYEAISARRFPPRTPTAPPPAQQSAEQPAQAQAAHPTLPTANSSFIGRQEELAAVVQLLQDQTECRLLTLIGPGGIGKTRLALQVAQQLSAEARTTFPDGVHFVALAAVTDPGHLVRVIAEAMGYAFTGSDDPQQQLVNFLRPQRVLLLIDNFEHMLAGRALVSTLLEAAHGLSILVTSREALDLPAEWLYPLGGLPIPDPQASLPAIVENSAVQLFVQRAQRVAIRFALTAENAAQVVRVCRLVDGMPLGLELAAAWMQALTLEELADEIATNLDILASELRNIPERHRSLRAVFEQTWQRLRPAERETLCRLAVFRGAFTREAAAAVANASLRDISTLVEKSLCRYQAGRYDIHELLRQFAFARMIDDEQRTVCARHSSFYGTLLAAQQAQLMTAREGEVLQTISDDFDNILAAWRYLITALQTPAEAEHAMPRLGQFVPILAAYFDRRALFWEGQRTFQQALAVLENQRDLRASGKSASAEIYMQIALEEAELGMHVGHYQAAKTTILGKLPSLRASTNRRQLARALTYLGPAQIRLGEYEAAEQSLLEALEIYTELELHLESTMTMTRIGNVYGRSAQYAKARAYYERTARIYEEVGYTDGLARCLSNIGSSYANTAELDHARRYYEEAYTIAQQSDNRLMVGIILSNLAYCAGQQAEWQDARAKYTESLAILRPLGETRWVTVILADSSFVLIALNDLSAAAQNLSEALTLARAHQLVGDGVQALGATALLLARQHQYVQGLTIAAHVRDDSRARGLGRQYCEELCHDLVDNLSEADYAAAQFRGQSTPHSSMIQFALGILDQR